MTSPDPAAPRQALGDPQLRWFLAAAAAITAVRVAALIISPLDLHGDEAQYWAWSREFAWGYYSKPPLIGWAIGLTTALFGDAAWAVRLASPFAHAIGAFALFALAHRMFTPRAGFWAGLMWLLMPGVTLSATIASTDALLLPLWSCALLAGWRLIETRAWGWAVALGLAIGFGALAKYAMLYFPVGLALAAVWSKPVRAAMLSWRGVAAGATALAVLAPNLFWNAQNGFATVTHTVDNANLQGDLLNPEELATFFGEQFAVAGPILFLALLVLAVQAMRRPATLDDRDRYLIAFIAPALLIIMGQALLSRAHANWAAAAYPAAIVWVVGRLTATRLGRGALGASAALHGGLAAFVLALAVAPSWADAIGGSDWIKRVRGWGETASVVRARVEAAPPGQPYAAIVTDSRIVFFQLSYQLRDWIASGEAPPLRIWVLRDGPGNHAEVIAPLTRADGAPVLFVTEGDRFAPFIRADFARYEPLEGHTVQMGAIKRELRFASAAGFAPVPRDEAFLRRVGR